MIDSGGYDAIIKFAIFKFFDGPIKKTLQKGENRLKSDHVEQWFPT